MTYEDACDIVMPPAARCLYRGAVDRAVQDAADRKLLGDRFQDAVERARLTGRSVLIEFEDLPVRAGR